jgi:hypothetical protein
MGVSRRDAGAGRCVCSRWEACGLSSARRLRAGRDDERRTGQGRVRARRWWDWDETRRPLGVGE